MRPKNDTDLAIEMGLMDAPIGYVGPGQAAPAATAPTAAAPSGLTPGQKPSWFIEPEWYPELKFAIQHTKGATVFGPRGSGKSTAVEVACAELGWEVELLQCSANMQSDAFLGGVPQSVGGNAPFVPGPLTVAVRDGRCFFAEEANAVHTGVWSCGNRVSDDSGAPLILPTGEKVAQHRNFRMVLAYNDGYSGMRDVNEALKGRLMPIYATYPSMDVEVAMLKGRTGATDAECENVVSLIGVIRATPEVGQFDLSIREMTRWVNMVQHVGMTWERAFEKAIVNLAGTPQTAAQLRDILTTIGKVTAGW